jgi:hypothetical protein
LTHIANGLKKNMAKALLEGKGSKKPKKRKTKHLIPLFVPVDCLVASYELPSIIID